MSYHRLRTPVRALTALASVLLMGAFAPPNEAVLADRAAEMAPANPGTPGVTTPYAGKLTEHVVVISIDGLRPDAIQRFGAKTLQKLMREGSYTLQARTIMPSKTLPSHTSMLTGVEVEDHGITWNNDQTDVHGVVAVPTIFGAARQHGLRTAAFFSKTKFHHLDVPMTLDHVMVPSSGSWTAGRTVGNVERYLAGNAPNLMFVHIGDVDYMGHFWGWMSWPYGRAVRKADDAVEAILKASDAQFGAGNYTVIVTADHGGHGRNHGSDDLRDVMIPWITWGKGVRGGTVLADGVRTMDTAATALWLIGAPVTTAGDGSPVTHAFTSSSAPVQVALR